MVLVVDFITVSKHYKYVSYILCGLLFSFLGNRVAGEVHEAT